MANRDVVYEQSYGRVPIIALDYNQRHLRRCKEMMVDYTNGNLYITDAYDRNIIYDVVSKIIETVKGTITGNDIIVNIEGVGEINLTQFLADLNDRILYPEIHDEGTTYVPGFQFDNKSIEVLDNTIQICDFDSAEVGDIPFKAGDYLKWMKPGNSPSTPVKDPTDGVATDPSNITLYAWDICKSSNLPANVNVTLNNTGLESAYGTIVWNIAVTDTIPKLTFPTNVKFTFNTDPTLFEKCIATFKFETFTFGSIWLCTVEKYLNIPEQEITESYIYDKFSWKTIDQ